jgi:tRNA threonylcarbamoyladenosine biosynthesis protein TsaB
MGFTLLGIDTATESASVALYDGETGPRAESSWQTSAHHTVELMPSIVSMLERQGLTTESLDGVSVALGPGSFTGLRIGLSVAKGLSFSLEIPIVGIPTLDIVAYAHYEQDLPICAIIQAGRGRICAAFYERAGTEWQRLTDYQLATIDELSGQVRVPTLFCGEIDPSLGKALRSSISTRAIIASAASSLRRAGYLAELSWERFRQGEADDVTTLEPLYLHYPDVSE